MKNKGVWIATGAAAVAGLIGAALYFSWDDTTAWSVKFDPKVHTKAFLLDILEELKIEYASLYLHWFNMLMKMRKEKGEVPNNILSQIQSKLEELTNEIDREVAEKYNISDAFINDLLVKY